MRTPAFWYRRPGAVSALLAPLGTIYGAIAARRMIRPADRPSPLPVVCVGNFVAGGAGKTPTALALADIARRSGLTPAFLTRGHGGRLVGPIIVEPGIHGAADVGDEALLLAASAATVVARRRADGLDLVVATGADLCIMDDGFQNPTVEKTLALAVVDGAVGVGNGGVLPAGPLRAPLAAQMNLADAVVVIGAGTPGEDIAALAARAGHSVLTARLAVVGPRLNDDRPFYAFTGIGRPDKFFDQLEAEGYRLAGRRAFADHHRFTDEEATAILAEAERLGARPVTTEKDAVRIDRSTKAGAALASRSEVLRIACRFADSDAVGSLLIAAVDNWRRAHKAG